MSKMAAAPIPTTAKTAQSVPAQKAISRPRRFWRYVYLLSFAVLVYFYFDGFSYYMTPYALRPHHEQYRLLRPAGSRGLVFGLAGAAMILLMLLYSLRKRSRLLGRIGNLASWLNFHIYLGIMGPLLVLLHSSFKVQGLVAVAFWSMVLVAASGVFGRYLYRLVPRNIQGNQLSLQELEEISGKLTALLKSEFGLIEPQIARLDQIDALEIPEGAGPFRTLAVMFNDWLRTIFLRRHRLNYARSLGVPKGSRKRLVELTQKRTLLLHRIRLMHQIQQLFHYWHVVHKPFAIVMYVVMFVHIGVAVWTGYAWIF